MISGEKILFFGGSDWWYHNPSSGIQILEVLIKARNQALYVNNIPLRFPKPGKVSGKNRYFNKIKSYLRFLRSAKQDLWVLTPITLPFFFGNVRTNAINALLLKWQIRLAFFLIGWRNIKPVVICMTPAAGLVLPSIDRKASIYYLCDKFDKFRDIVNPVPITKLDAEVAHQSDALICVSKAIYDSYANSHPHAEYVPHGANLKVFNRAVNETFAKPYELATITGPIIGYFGSITESNDKAVLEYIAKQRPNYNIVLIGQVISDYSRLDAYPNIHFLGKKPLDNLPAYGQHFDVCIMNWIMNEWIRYCSPVKIKEYLAMGKPVVSVPIPEVVALYSDVVSIASTPLEFVEKIDYELQNDSITKKHLRIEKVRHDSWDAVAHRISSIIEKIIYL